MAYPRAIVGWGPETVLALDSHDNLISGFYPGVRVHPAPIYETILYMGVFSVLWALRKKVQVEGRIFYLYLILAGASRFMVEFVRINPAGHARIERSAGDRDRDDGGRGRRVLSFRCAGTRDRFSGGREGVR